MFGSVTSADISVALVTELSVEIDRRDVQLQEPIKDLGVFTVPIQLHPEITADLKVVVVREEDK